MYVPMPVSCVCVCIRKLHMYVIYYILRYMEYNDTFQIELTCYTVRKTAIDVIR